MARRGSPPNNEMQLTGGRSGSRQWGLALRRAGTARASSSIAAAVDLGVGRTLEACAGSEEDGDSTTHPAESRGLLSCL